LAKSSTHHKSQAQGENTQKVGKNPHQNK